METSNSAADGPLQLCSLIGKLRAELVYDIEQELGRQDVHLNFSQCLALKHLNCDPSMAPGELARTLSYNPGALTRLLDKLERLGYLRRVPDPVDRRALRLELTTAGKAVRERVIACASSVAERALACTSEREREKLRTLLTRVLDGIQENRKSPTSG
jgi:DNA-binding MarR family transcriptional regulator